jgi:signal peptidase I
VSLETHSSTFEPLAATGPIPKGPIPVPSLELEVGPKYVERRSRSSAKSLRWLVEWVLVLLLALLVAFGVRTYVAQIFYIPSGSMLPTLQIGDRIVVDKLSYDIHGVHRGDIVVFRRPPLEQADYPDLVKRVIGLPGDTIASIGGRVYVNGQQLAEPWLPTPNPPTYPSPLNAAFSLNHPFLVPAGEYFVMGDNRTNSEDSRYFGPISQKLIVGKMMFVVWPLSDLSWMVILGVVAAAAAVATLVVLVLPSLRRRPSPVRGPPSVPVTW